MKKVFGIAALTLASLLLVLVILWRLVLFEYFEERYPAVIYFAQISALDDQTALPVDFDIDWDHKLITPFSKGSGPSRIGTGKDKSKTVAIVGLARKGGLPIKLVASGYHPRVIRIWSYDGPNQVEEVRLNRINSGASTGTKNSETEQAVDGNPH